MKLADMQDLGSCVVRCAGSSPVARTKNRAVEFDGSVFGAKFKDFRTFERFIVIILQRCYVFFSLIYKKAAGNPGTA